jgi:hypothetical protein
MKKRKLLRRYILLIGCIIIAVSGFSELTAASCVIGFSSVVVTNRNGCSPTNDASICVTISYTGVPLNNQFDLSINNGLTWTLGSAGTSTICKNNLAAGEYKLIIRDRNGCTTTYPGNPVTIEHDICIPDANFKAILVSNNLINKNLDAEIQRSEAVDYTGEIDAGYSSIADLAGLEEFTSLSSFSCLNNPAITQIDVSKNIALDKLYCGYCSIYELDVSKNTLLKYIICTDNLLADLDLSNNPLLSSLQCGNNQIDSLSLINNPLLEKLNCESNIIEQLDLSANPALEYLKCSDNLLNHLNLKNGNNTNITTLDGTSNPDLSCVLVDDVDYAETNWESYFDAGVSFSLDCNPIPEDENITNTSFNSGDTTCYGAYQTITVGDIAENPVFFDAGSSTSLIAGSSITFLPGAHIQDGAYLSATITTDSSYCDLVEAKGSPIVAIKPIDKSGAVTPFQTKPIPNQSMKVFPNPNSGKFNIELSGFSDRLELVIYNASGSILLKQSTGNANTEVIIPEHRKGLFFVKVIHDKKTFFQKVIIY